mgnify:CR=1 FL=1
MSLNKKRKKIQYQDQNIKSFLGGPTATSLALALISALTHFPMHSKMIETTNFGTLKRPLMTWHSIKKEKKYNTKAKTSNHSWWGPLPHH